MQIPAHLWCLQCPIFDLCQQLADLTGHWGHLKRERESFSCGEGLTSPRALCDKSDAPSHDDPLKRKHRVVGITLLCHMSPWVLSMLMKDSPTGIIITIKARTRSSYLLCESTQQLYSFGQITFNQVLSESRQKSNYASEIQCKNCQQHLSTVKCGERKLASG